MDGEVVEDLIGGESLTVTDRDVTLSGRLTDGSEFTYALNGSSIPRKGHFFSQDATLTVTPVDGTPIIPGDVNLDGQFNADDIIQVLAELKFEIGVAATFAEGDWNAAPNAGFIYESGVGPPPRDGFFNTADIIAALAAGHYEKGPVLAAVLPAEDLNNIPEPSTISLLIASGLTFVTLRLRSCKTITYRIHDNECV